MLWLGSLVLKGLLYFGVVAFGARQWAATLQYRGLRVFLGGLARFALGWIVGIPAGFILGSWFHEDAGAGFYALFFTLRFLLWLLVLRVAFSKAPIREVAALSFAGVVLNAALDLALPKSLIEMFHVSFC